MTRIVNQVRRGARNGGNGTGGRPRGSGSRPVIGVHQKTGKTIRLCGGMAMIDAGFSQSGIWKCCNGIAKQHAGFTWEYEDVILEREKHNKTVDDLH
ncbi:endonuclease [Pantoea phage vB_PagM_LIET2]|uniref:Endonuclease n=1 Tax=Pantoea phage vB_PagM_LIET2 TaxID=2508071 RepID=A0A411AWB3_9CAUD|nr:endonuclease [Pantoea phage vB_PagM_LIET2]QAX92355.1 endonuclease [Pantoea phage vB_PagM_LIET2]